LQINRAQLQECSISFLSTVTKNPCSWISIGCLFVKTNLSTVPSFKCDRCEFILIQWFKRSDGSWPSQSSLWSHGCCRIILHTTTIGLIKPNGSNITITFKEIILGLKGEFFGSLKFEHRFLWKAENDLIKDSVADLVFWYPQHCPAQWVLTFLCNQRDCFSYVAMTCTELAQHKSSSS
jgi:hypothetical protein